MSSVKKACLCSVCTALCYVLPLALHLFGLGKALSPIHLPVLLCGLVCGAPYGAFCGVAGPVISSVLSGMPSASQLAYMVPELAAYGLCAGWGMRLIRTGRTYPDLLLSLLPAMLLGRIAGGAAQAAFFLSARREYTAALWAGTFLVSTAPGAAMQLAVLPVLVLTLERAKLIPARYPSKGGSI